MSEHIKHLGDLISGGVVIATIFQWAPLFLAIPSAIYAILRIIEWFEKRSKK